ncbi:MAG: Na(+)/H(+) antiporter subunit B [Spirochaetota bacterium]
MVARIFAILAIAGFALIALPLVTELPPMEELTSLARTYVERTPDELGAANVVTAVIVTYRGLDTLGEVSVLFIATAGVGFLLRRQGPAVRSGGDGVPAEPENGPGQAPSEILATGARFLMPVVLLFGVYIFTHGHLTPGGGFQGGVIVASAMLLYFLSTPGGRVGHTALTLVESLSGASYVFLGVLGLVLAAGFLDNRLMPLGEFGRLFSAGAIPVIYSLVGLKVGAELSGILDHLRSREGDHA